MENQPWVGLVGILVEVIYASCVEAAGTALDAMNFIALLKQELSEIAAILTSNAGDQGFFHTGRPISFEYIRKGYIQKN